MREQKSRLADRAAARSRHHIGWCDSQSLLPRRHNLATMLSIAIRPKHIAHTPQMRQNQILCSWPMLMRTSEHRPERARHQPVYSCTKHSYIRVWWMQVAMCAQLDPHMRRAAAPSAWEAHLMSHTNTGAASVRLLTTYCIKMSSQLPPWATYSSRSSATVSQYACKTFCLQFSVSQSTLTTHVCARATACHIIKVGLNRILHIRLSRPCLQVLVVHDCSLGERHVVLLIP